MKKSLASVVDPASIGGRQPMQGEGRGPTPGLMLRTPYQKKL